MNKYLTSSEIKEFFYCLLNTADPFLDQKEEKKKGIIPAFQKQEIKAVVYKGVRYHYILFNLLKKRQDVKVISLLRSPFAVINSWVKAPKEFRRDLGWKIEEEWRFAPLKNQNRPEEFNGYEKWKEVAFLFLKLKEEFPERVYIVLYEKMLRNPLEEVNAIFQFSDLELHQQTIDFIKSSTSSNKKDAYSVYKKKEQDDAWKTELPRYIIEGIKNDPDFQKLNNTFHWI